MTAAATPARNRRTGLLAGAVACLMVGAGFAAVPLYRLFCQQTGYGGTARIEEGARAPGAIGRMVTVRFDANVSAKLGWRFEPEKKTLPVAVGAREIAFFDATNLSDRPLTGSAAFNVSPDESAQYFVKVQCFCFTQQTLQPGETQRMPVVFYIDPAFIKDRDMAGVKEITLSYTFYPVDHPVPQS